MASQSSGEFNQWVSDYSDELYSWAYYKTSSKETAEDLVQDTFMAAFAKIDSFEGKSKAKTWLFSILNNKIIDFYRKNARISTTSLYQENIALDSNDELFKPTGQWQESAAVHEEHWLDNPEFNAVLASCLEKLPTNWQFAIQSKYLSTKDSKDICEELDITLSNYWQIVHRAKLSLRKCIDSQWV